VAHVRHTDEPHHRTALGFLDEIHARVHYPFTVPITRHCRLEVDYSVPAIGVGYCDERVCLSVRKRISGRRNYVVVRRLHVRTSLNFLAMLHIGRGSVLLWLHCNSFQISAFVGGVIFFTKYRVLA